MLAFKGLHVLICPLKFSHLLTRKILGRPTHGGEYEDDSLIGYNALWFC
jgi:hypothetical protein